MPTPSYHPSSRQYVFRARRDRQRIAQRLAAGMGAAEVAAVERCAAGEIGRLLGDLSFRKLVQAYEDLMTAPPETRRARLVALAEEILIQEVMAGNDRACAFLLHLTAEGRDAAATLADAVGAALLRAKAGRGPSRIERGKLAGPPPPDPRPAGEPEAARRRYAGEMAMVAHRLGRTAAGLRRRVVAEGLPRT